MESQSITGHSFTNIQLRDKKTYEWAFYGIDLIQSSLAPTFKITAVQADQRAAW